MRLTADKILTRLPGVLRNAREEEGLTVQQAAAATGFSPQTIENSERPGRPYPALEYLLGLLDAYGVSLRDLEELLREERGRQLRSHVEGLERRVAKLEGGEDERPR
jgi:transcriptional regulator with XRE-family HTH domain